jgi:HEAT repeat protein
MRIHDVLRRAGGPTSLVGLALVLTTSGTSLEARAQQPGSFRAVGTGLPEFLPAAGPDDKDKERKDQPKAPADDKGQSADLSDMAQALLNSGDGAEPEVRRARVKQFVDGVKSAIQQGNENGDLTLRAAVATMVGEFAASARGGVRGTRTNYQMVTEVLPPLTDTMAALSKADTSPEVRAAAARALAKCATALDPSVVEFVDKLERALLDRDSSTDAAVSEAAARDLAKLRNTGEIDNLLKDKDPEVRQAAENLAKLRGTAGATAGALEHLLKDDKDLEVRRATAAALTAALRGTVAADRSALSTPVIEPSVHNLILCGPTVARAAGTVLGGGEGDAQVRRLCADALLQVATTLDSRLRSADSRTILQPVVESLWKQTGALARAVNDPDPRVRQTAMRALEAMGDARRHWVNPERLERLPTTPTPEKPLRPLAPRTGAAPAAEEMSGLALTYAAEQVAQPPRSKDEPLAPAEAIPALVRALSDDDVRNRLAAVDALETITSRGDDERRAGRTVAQNLGKRPAADAARAVTRALSDPDRFVRWAAARTLGKMAPLDDVEDGERVQRGAVAALARALSDNDPTVRLRTAYALEQFGQAGPKAQKAAQDAVPALAVAAGRGDPEVRIFAAHAIQMIGSHPKEAVPALAAGLSDRNVRLRRVVAEALASYGPDALDAKPALSKALVDPDAEVRRLASDALLKIGARH